MGRLRRGADREGVLAFVAEGGLLLALAAPRLSFVPTLFGLATAGMPGVVGELADVPAAVLLLTDVVRAGDTRLLDDRGPTVGSSVSSTVVR